MYCKRCGTPLHTGVVICPECGARQRRQASSVRCASCHGRVPLTLSVCPRCGRDVRPAGPRWGLWLAAAIAMVAWCFGASANCPWSRWPGHRSASRRRFPAWCRCWDRRRRPAIRRQHRNCIARATPEAPPTTTAGEEQPVVAPQAEPSVDVGEAESPTSEPSPAEPGLVAEVETPTTDEQTATNAPTADRRRRRRPRRQPCRPRPPRPPCRRRQPYLRRPRPPRQRPATMRTSIGFSPATRCQASHSGSM